MQSFSETYDDLEAAIDDVRQLLDDWLKASDEAPMSTWLTSGTETGGSRDPTRRSSSQNDVPSRANRSGQSPPGPRTSDPSRSNSPASEDTSRKSTPGEDPSGPGSPGARGTGPKALEDGASYDFVPSASTTSHRDDSTEASGRPSVLRYVQVVLHEWIANMIQHADFGGNTPHIEITVRADRRFVSCSVIDNSRGFDLAGELATQRNEARALPERGMGLRIISACTEQCAYRSLPDGRYRFEFSIPVDHDPWLSTLF